MSDSHPQSSPPKTRHLPERCLYISPSGVEWAWRDASGQACVRQCIPASEDPQALALAAQEALGDQASSAGRFRLLLGSALLQERVVELPELTRAQLVHVLERRSQQNVGEECLIGALALGTANPDGQQHWLLSAGARARLKALYRALEAHKLRPSTVLPSTWALIGAACEHAPAASESCAAICVEPDAVTVAVITPEGLQQHSTLRGNLVESATLGAALLHELRSLDAQWRKEHQGRPIASTCVLGLSSDRARSLCQALSTVLPGAQQGSFPAAATSSEQARAECLLAAATQNKITLNLYLPRPRPALRWASAAALLTLGASVGLVFASSFESERESIVQASEQLSTHTHDLPALQQLHSTVRGTLDQVQAGIASAAAAQDSGFDLITRLDSIADALGPQVRLGERRFDLDGARISGSYAGSAKEGMATLTQAAERLAKLPWVGGLEIEPLKRNEDSAQLEFPFEVRIRWEAATSQ